MKKKKNTKKIKKENSKLHAFEILNPYQEDISCDMKKKSVSCRRTD